MKTATFMSRVWARTLDGLIIGLPITLVVYVGFYFSLGLGMSLTILTMPISYLYEILLISSTGQTLGKKALGIKVVRLDAGPVDLSHSIRRSAIEILVGVTPVLFSLYFQLELLGKSIDGGGEYAALPFLEKLKLTSSNNGSGFLLVVTSLSYAYILAQLICIWVDHKSRNIHDFLADTRVVQVNPDGSIAADAASVANLTT